MVRAKPSKADVDRFHIESRPAADHLPHRAGRTADEVLEEVERRVRDHVGSDVREDDFTMIAVKLT